jgi:hypothetical protein
VPVVAVGPFHILETDKGKLDRAGLAAETHVTILNVDLDHAVAQQVAAGAEIVPQRLEHRPSADDADEPGPAFR